MPKIWLALTTLFTRKFSLPKIDFADCENLREEMSNPSCPAEQQQQYEEPEIAYNAAGEDNTSKPFRILDPLANPDEASVLRRLSCVRKLIDRLNL